MQVIVISVEFLKNVELGLGHTHTKCRALDRQEGIFASLFTTIAALKLFEQNENIFGYKFDYAIGYGTLIAQQRNVLIFPWDSDSDMLILFEKDFQTPNQFEKFRLDLKNMIQYIDKLNKYENNNNNNNDGKTIAKPQLPNPVSLSDVNINITNQDFINGKTDKAYIWSKNNPYCRNQLCVIWNLKHGARDPAITKHYFNQIHIQTLPSSTGFNDLFILQRNEKNPNMVRNDHCCAGFVNDYQPVSLIFPSNKLATWSIYGPNINVQIPAKSSQVLAIDYGIFWKYPNVNNTILHCPNFNQSQIEYFINKKYKATFKIITSHYKNQTIQNDKHQSILSKLFHK